MFSVPLQIAGIVGNLRTGVKGSATDCLDDPNLRCLLEFPAQSAAKKKGEHKAPLSLPTLTGLQQFGRRYVSQVVGFGNFFTGDLTVHHVQTVQQVLVSQQRFLVTLISQFQDVGQGSVVQREG